MISWWWGGLRSKKQRRSCWRSLLEYISFSLIISTMDCRKSRYGSSESLTTATLSLISCGELLVLGENAVVDVSFLGCRLPEEEAQRPRFWSEKEGLDLSLGSTTSVAVGQHPEQPLSFHLLVEDMWRRYGGLNFLHECFGWWWPDCIFVRGDGVDFNSWESLKIEGILLDESSKISKWSEWIWMHKIYVYISIITRRLQEL